MNTINYSSESFPAQVASGGIAMGKALIIGKKAFLKRTMIVQIHIFSRINSRNSFS